MSEALHERTRPTLGVATGSSPLVVYQQLATLVDDGSLDLSTAAMFALDEYVGLPAEHPESYRSVLNRELVALLHLDPGQVHVPDGCASDLNAEAAGYEELIRARGGIDVQLLGIGSNGHIGFNEPGSSLMSRTRVERLAATTRADNARFFEDIADVPRLAVTQGLGTIMEARQIILVAQGRKKAAPVAQMIEGPVSSMSPASILQFHANTTIVLDELAAAGLRGQEYLRNGEWEEQLLSRAQ
jgi:glucosamine-6-phosphate deaminase